MCNKTKHVPGDVKAVGIGLLGIYLGAVLVVFGIPLLILFIAYPAFLLILLVLGLFLAVKACI